MSVVKRQAKPIKFEMTVTMDTEAFNGDSWDREAELGRILRLVAEAMYGGIVPPEAELRDRHGRPVGSFRFRY